MHGHLVLWGFFFIFFFFPLHILRSLCVYCVCHPFSCFCESFIHSLFTIPLTWGFTGLPLLLLFLLFRFLFFQISNPRTNSKFPLCVCILVFRLLHFIIFHSVTLYYIFILKNFQLKLCTRQNGKNPQKSLENGNRSPTIGPIHSLPQLVQTVCIIAHTYTLIAKEKRKSFFKTESSSSYHRHSLPIRYQSFIEPSQNVIKSGKKLCS